MDIIRILCLPRNFDVKDCGHNADAEGRWFSLTECGFSTGAVVLVWVGLCSSVGLVHVFIGK